ncbi:hypothetical protein HMH01_11635 [Halovulum dunhuangense]|uniref:DUF1468 domain-containing protein n=1 Tax=Halovulum dunhuangense TaxID=1505036 RepID=A0A849L4L5_9RHOB|nr:tripartite tricarboxylate transporter TctB family protein [Halovulum dunhuangense]NNU81087.1 hypothetical protein [Halovulum dunhuangense]
MAQEPSRPERQLGGELIIPVLAVAFTLYYFTTIWNSPWTAQVSAFLIGGILLFCCALFVLRSAILLKKREASLGISRLFNREDIASGRLWLLLLTIAYCVLIDLGGFTLTTFFFLFLSMAVLAKGERLGLIAALSATMALGGWALFIWAFDTRFPRGPFENLMQGII